MNVDAFFTIGKTHKVCEDYIIGGIDPIPHIILCDGCSSSQNTDIGARLLAVSMQNAVKAIYKPNVPFNYDTLADASIALAFASVKLLDLNVNCLDATAIIAFQIGDKVHVYMYGDGVIITKGFINGVGDIGYIKVDYSTGAPYYLSYLIDSERRKIYEENSGDRTTQRVTYYPTPIANIPKEITYYFKYDEPLKYEFSIIETPIIMISSDGIDSFVNIHTGEKANLLDTITEFTNFKNTTGEFVKRRVKRAIEDYGKQGIYHGDDVSIGAINFKGEEK